MSTFVTEHEIQVDDEVHFRLIDRLADIINLPDHRLLGSPVVVFPMETNQPLDKIELRRIDAAVEVATSLSLHTNCFSM